MCGIRTQAGESADAESDGGFFVRPSPLHADVRALFHARVIQKTGIQIWPHSGL